MGKREAYLGAAQDTRGSSRDAARYRGTERRTVAPTDPRMVLLYTQVTEPWKRLLERAEAVRVIHDGEPATIPPDPPPTRSEVQHALLKTAREQIQTVSWYILLDLAQYLEQYLPAVWQVVMGQQPQSTLAGCGRAHLLTALQNTTVSDRASSMP